MCDKSNSDHPPISRYQAMLRGWRRRCPSCGAGALFKGYLAQVETCMVCREPMHIYRADDGPAYLTILIVGHLMAPTLHYVYVAYRPDPLILFTIFAVGCLVLSLYLLPRIKGMIIAYKWMRCRQDGDAPPSKSA